jgi:type I restriction enzyme S subunit
MTNFSGKPIASQTANAAGAVSEASAGYLAHAASEHFDSVPAGMVCPPGYKQTEVGVIPSLWKVLQIKELGLDISDGNYSSKYPRSDEFKPIGVPFIRANNIKGLTVVDEDMRYISHEKHAEITKGHLKEGDVLVTNRGEIGNIAQIVRINTGKGFLSGAYFAFYLQRTETNKLLLDMQTGSALKQLPVNRLITLPVVIPPMEEQTAIANALSDVDALISELEKLIAKKQAIKTATMQQLLTGRTRLPQFALREDGTPKGTKPSELGEIPEDWDCLDFADMFTCRQGMQVPVEKQSLVESTHTVRFIRIIDLTDQQEPPRYISNPGDKYLVKKYDLFMVRYGVPGLIGFNYEGVIANNLFRIIPRMSCFTAFYAHYLSYRHKDILDSSGSSTMPAISFSTLARFKIIKPLSEKEQTAIATILSDMDEEIQALEQRLGKTRQIKQGMMQELLTGKTRLVQPLNKESQHG